MRVEATPARRHRVPLTPLVDVVFILLFFFMLASSPLDWRALPLDLAAPENGGASARPATWRLDVRANELRLDGVVVDLPSIARRLTDAPGQRVVVAPADGVSLQELVHVLDGLRGTGAAVSLGGA